MSLGGWWSSINEPSTWASFEDARKARKGDGVGFVLNGDGIVCIDLDDCVTDGVISDEAQSLIDSFPKTFVEFSPSNRGIHLWGLGTLHAGRRFERNGLKIEVYGTGRYLTVTGKTLVQAPLAELSLQDLIG
jgi:primase-polymerase (primpol)-like protein